MAEKSHKREMGDALRGDFERLRSRLERAERRAPAAVPAHLVLTPPQPVDQGPVAAEQVASPAERPRLRSVFRRR